MKPRSCFWWDRFWNKVEEDQETGCWIWTAAKNKKGYGCFAAVRKPLVNAHRFIYRQLVGPIPSWLEIDHLCRNPACVNPAHLEAVTHQENSLRGIGPMKAAAYQLGKTNCPQGHPYDEENTYWYKAKRYCKICQREANTRWRRRKAER